MADDRKKPLLLPPLPEFQQMQFYYEKMPGMLVAMFLGLLVGVLWWFEWFRWYYALVVIVVPAVVHWIIAGPMNRANRRLRSEWEARVGPHLTEQEVAELVAEAPQQWQLAHRSYYSREMTVLNPIAVLRNKVSNDLYVVTSNYPWDLGEKLGVECIEYQALYSQAAVSRLD